MSSNPEQQHKEYALHMFMLNVKRRLVILLQSLGITGMHLLWGTGLHYHCLLLSLL